MTLQLLLWMWVEKWWRIRPHACTNLESCLTQWNEGCWAWNCVLLKPPAGFSVIPTQTYSSTHYNQCFPVSRLRGGVIQSFGSEGASTHLRCGVFFPFSTDLSEDVMFYITTTTTYNQVFINWLMKKCIYLLVYLVAVWFGWDTVTAVAIKEKQGCSSEVNQQMAGQAVRCWVFLYMGVCVFVEGSGELETADGNRAKSATLRLQQTSLLLTLLSCSQPPW